VQKSMTRQFIGYYNGFDRLCAICNAISERGIVLIPSILPEDTTEKVNERQPQITKYGERNYREVFKAILWIAVAIVIALLVGQLS
jgi:hypothetical protein